MYRIDENTSIDDSLVTCAEYQLFIDEMRALGKYSQPDHWTCFQFPTGQAKKPIRGVRPSDAIAFCEWLTGREDGCWHYRLPTAKEATDCPLYCALNTISGYWTVGQEGEAQFAWAGATPLNARTLVRARAITNQFDADLTRALTLDFSVKIPLDFDRVRIFGIDRARAIALDLDLRRARIRALNLDAIRSLDPDFVLALDRYRACGSDMLVDFGLARAHALALIAILKLARGRGVDLYIDILTLQERIAGRSSAFEGIRLVKERVR